jgi:hypothetical protein
MKEKDLAQEFKSLFFDYTPRVITNNAVPGWPDRMLQCPGSVVVFVELKFIKELNQDYSFRIKLTREQAVWLSLWQRQEGKCFLFLGFNKEVYGILTQLFWKDWLNVPDTLYYPSQLTHVLNTKPKVLEWFREWLANPEA